MTDLGHPAAPTRDRSVTVGIGCFLVALLLFAFYDAFAKQMVASYPPTVVNLGRYTAFAIAAVILLLRHGDLRIWRQPHQGALILRGLTLAIVATAFMTALVTMPLAEATAIYFTAPMIMVALSPWVVGERVTRTQWMAVLIGFAGMLFIVRPGGSLPLVGTLLMALSAVCYAVFQLLTRRLAGKVPMPVQFAYMAGLCLVITHLPVYFMPEQALPPWPEMLVLIGGGFVSVGAQLLLLAAFRRVSAATIAPLNYLQLLLAVLISSLWFQQPPDGLALVGMALIAFAGLMLARALRRPAPAIATP